MKNIFFIITFFLHSFSFAGGGGGGGGGGWRPEPIANKISNNELLQIKNPIFIKNLNEIRFEKNPRILIAKPLSTNGLSEFATGTVVDQQWQIQNFIVPTDSINDSYLIEKIQNSIESNDWVDLQN